MKQGLLFNNVTIENRMDFGMLFNDQHYSSAHIDGEILANDITINNTTVDLDGAVAQDYQGSILSAQNGSLTVGGTTYSTAGATFKGSLK